MLLLVLFILSLDYFDAAFKELFAVQLPITILVNLLEVVLEVVDHVHVTTDLRVQQIVEFLLAQLSWFL